MHFPSDGDAEVRGSGRAVCPLFHHFCGAVRAAEHPGGVPAAPRGALGHAVHYQVT